MPEHAPETIAYISAGSSIEPQKHLDEAVVMLRERVDVLAISTVYRTPAVGRPNDPHFLNCVIQVRTSIPPRALKFAVLRGIEERVGRDRSPDKYAPRTLDLDLILYGDKVADEPELTIPHPDLSRWFVRVPVLELSPALVVPGLRRELRDLDGAGARQDQGTALPDFTELLRRRLKE